MTQITSDVLGFYVDSEVGTGLFLRRTTLAGHHWHIASIIPALFIPNHIPESERKPVSIFVAPFRFGSWPGTDFNEALTLSTKPQPLVEQWLKQTGYTVIDQWQPVPRYTASLWKQSTND